MRLKNIINPFFDSIASKNIEIYNEFSLQHELGIFLRKKFPDHKIQFERNVSYFFNQKKKFTKREIDISVFLTEAKQSGYAIELKYPRNGQHPEQMFSFCKDIAFIEELCRAGFSGASLIILADDELFYNGQTEGIYRFFRGGQPIHGRIQKPTGKKDEELTINGSYVVKWKPICDERKYAIVEVGEPFHKS